MGPTLQVYIFSITSELKVALRVCFKNYFQLIPIEVPLFHLSIISFLMLVCVGVLAHSVQVSIIIFLLLWQKCDLSTFRFIERIRPDSMADIALRV